MSFDTSILDAAIIRRRAKQERRRLALLNDVLRLLDHRAAQFGIRRAYLFGSIIRPGHFGDLSDVDIGVEALSPAQYCSALAVFSTELGCKVDLVELDQCHFAAKVRREGVVWMPSA